MGFFDQGIGKYIQNRLYLLLPSHKLKQDVCFQGEIPDGLRPASLIRFSLTAPIQRKFLKLREANKELCVTRSQEKLSVIIPYRHREVHLKQLLPELEKQLRKQSIDYEIIVVEQDNENPFNKAKLMNIGALNARDDSTYYVFHDVDIVPVQADYRGCNHTVRLFSTLIRNGEETLYSDNIFGGVVLVPKNIFFDINGFSNQYEQWGNEDDDFLYRHLFKGEIPLLDINGRFDELIHVHALNADIKGREVKTKGMQKKNDMLRKKNRTRFSHFKRGISCQMQDGVQNVGRYEIGEVERCGDSIRIIKVSF